jgi:tetratricopeptide (TPR) repeat protein
LYEQLARQLAVRLSRLQNQKREAEAEALSKGVQLVLQELRSSQNLSPRTILFIAQTLATIGDYDSALEEARKIEAPKVADLPGVESNTEWWQVDVTKIADNQVRTRFQDACRDYRVAILIQARCLRQSGKLQEAKALLDKAIGDQKNRGWGFTSLDLRRELAYTYEAQAAAESNSDSARLLWRNALNEWTTLFQYARADVQRLNEDTPAEQVRRVKSAFFDAFYEVQRVLIAANKQLQKDQALQRSLETVGRRIAEMEITNKIAEHEAQGNSIILPETWNRYYELLLNEPIVKKAYQDNQGKLFLQPPPQ